MSAQKKVRIENRMSLLAECHPLIPMKVTYVPDRGGDRIEVKCGECYRIFFNVKLPREHDAD